MTTTLKKILNFTFWMTTFLFFTSCSGQDSGVAPGGAIAEPTSLEITEITPTEKVISNVIEVEGVTEDVVERKMSGALTIEGVFHE